MSDDAKRAGANAESEPLNLRIPLALAEELRRFAKTLPIVSKHRIAVEALKLGFASIQADPGILLRGAATPSPSAPATPAAPAPSRPVVVAAPAPDTRQLELAPVVALHNAANGANVATVLANDNGVSPATPKRTREPSPARTINGPVVDLDALKVRLAAAGEARWTVKAIAKRAGVNDSGLIQWRKGASGLGPTVAGKLDATLTTLGF